jgi:rSAM/selenodomain-associated transferase 2
MRLAVVVPVLDEAPAITGTLQALAPLRERGAVVVVADGGSRDHTAELARPWADSVVTAPRGRARQMNAGAQADAAATADVLLFLHADTRLPPDADRLVVQALTESSHHWGRFDVCIEGRSALLPVVAKLMNLRSRVTGIATGDQAMFVRRSTFLQVSGFPDQPLMEDVEISRRLKRVGPPQCLRQRVVTSGRRWDQRGPWRTVLLMWRLRLLYWLGARPEQLAKWYR